MRYRLLSPYLLGATLAEQNESFCNSYVKYKIALL